MIKSFILFLLTTILIHGKIFAQRNFRIKEAANKSYIIPPHVNLRFARKTKEVKKKFSYFYVFLTDLKSIYENDLKRLRTSVSWNGKVDLVAAEIANSRGCNCSIGANRFFKWYFPNNKGTNLFLQFDFNALNNGDIKENFRLMMIDLIKSFAVLEADKPCNCAGTIKLAKGFSQQIVKNLKEVIPVPSNLPQPGSCITAVADQSYIMLLDDDIILKVDDVRKIETPLGNDKKFRYEWAGFKYFSFKRALDGTITQNGLAAFSNGLPTNEFQKDVYNLASITDIVSSEALKDIHYIALYHPPLKRNNDHSAIPSLGMYKPADDKNIMEGNAFLLHFRSSKLSVLDFNQKHDNSDGITKSFFSERGSIAPMIKVYINGEEKIEDFDVSTSSLSELPEKFCLYRKYGGNYRKVRGKNHKLILLPNDHLIYKL